MVTTVVLPGTEVDTDVTVVRGWLVGVDVGAEDTVVARGWLGGTDVATEVAVVAGGRVFATGAVTAVVAGASASGTKAGAGLLSTDWAPAMTTPPKRRTAPAVRAMARVRLNMT